jgi:hypothetical protein
VDEFLKSMNVALAVANFEYTMMAKRRILEPMYAAMQATGPEYRRKKADIQSWSDGQWLDAMTRPAAMRLLQEHNRDQAVYEDSAAAILLLTASQMERFYKDTRISLFKRGADSYVSGVKFSRAVVLLGNQYKHLGSWRSSEDRENPRAVKNRRVVAMLVENPLGTDAAAEFLLRSAFTDYQAFQDALLSCTEGIVGRPLVADGTNELPTVKVQYKPAEEAK